MENQFFNQYGIPGICVLLALSVVIRVGEFLWNLREKKEVISEKCIQTLTKAVEENTKAILNLDNRLAYLEHAVADWAKFKQRFYAAVKGIAGDRWPEIRDEILKDDFTL